jgi:hypothetical protein
MAFKPAQQTTQTKLLPTAEQQAIIETAKKGFNLAIKAFAGASKAQPSYCKIKTPSGDITMGDIEVGDAIFRKDGTIGKVIGKFPQGTKPTFRVIFRDGSMTYCNDEHLWTVENIGSRAKTKTFKTVTLAEIRRYGVTYESGSYKWKIPLCEPVQYETKEFYIHPYLLGLLIGDGSLTGSVPCLSIGKNEWGILDELQSFLPEGYAYSIRNTSENCKQLTLHNGKYETKEGCNLILRELKNLALNTLSGEKHIPISYLQGDIQQRLWLLHGLMDSDSSCCNNRTRFNSTSYNLIQDIKTLVQSLGGTAIEGLPQGNEDERNLTYTLNIKMSINPFYNSSKSSKWKYSEKNPPSRFITAIEPVQACEQFCIKVDAADSLYLTDEFIVTHNTTTCMMIAKELSKPSLYIAFNKSIADEAKEKFPDYVECRTIHSLAYGEIVNCKMRKKLQNFFNYGDFENLPSFYKLGGVERGFDLKLEIIEVIKKFCQSDIRTLTGFIAADYKNLGIETEEKSITILCVEFWNALIDPSNSTKIIPDIYLKLYQLTDPILPHKVIYLDESQDSSPVILDIVLSQTHAQIIIVGDPYQAIYEWRGAVNAFELIPDTFVDMYLSESFRFTQDIADMATKLLSIAGNERGIIGRAKPAEIKNGNVYIDGELEGTATVAILARNNSTILGKLLEAVELDQKVYCLADLKSLWGKLYHINSLYFKEKPKFPDKELSEYKTYGELLQAAEKLPELKKLVTATVILSKGGLHKNIEKIKRILVNSEDDADFTISTSHKSKGLEWDKVIICDDIIPVDKEGEINEEELVSGQTINLIYVALTRGKYEVQIPYDLINILSRVDYFKDTKNRYDALRKLLV